jgi:tetratricopeptide (TPR) repeat protein
LPTAKDADVLAAFTQWNRASAELDAQKAEAAEKRLLLLREELGMEDVEPVSAALLRAAATKQDGSSLVVAQTAVDLSPDVPFTHFALAETQLANGFNFLGAAREVQLGLTRLWKDPRYSASAWANVGTEALLAWVATTWVVVVLLAMRRVRFLFHDVRHLVAGAAAKWQISILLVVVLALPVLFGLGPFYVLIALFAGMTFYLEWRERLVAAALLVGVALTPVAGAWLAQGVAFFGTPAEDAYLVERGGVEAPAALARIQKRVSEDRGQFQDLYALGRYETRRGHLDEAIPHFQKASALRPSDARLLTNLANAYFAKGDADNAQDLYTTASGVEPGLAAPYFNVARLSARRAALLPADQAAAESEKGQNALNMAQRLDASLLTREDAPDKATLNRLLIEPGLLNTDLLALSDQDIVSRAQTELSERLMGNGVEASMARMVGLAALALCVVLGGIFARGRAHACDRCGRAVCRHCDPELKVGSPMCYQCVRAFRGGSGVSPDAQIAKRLEAHRYNIRRQRLTLGVSLLVSGTGHVVVGAVVRGALYVFLFLFCAAEILLRHGAVRAPYGVTPLWLTTAPAAALLLLLYAGCLLGLRQWALEGGADGT